MSYFITSSQNRSSGCKRRRIFFWPTAIISNQLRLRHCITTHNAHYHPPPGKCWPKLKIEQQPGNYASPTIVQSTNDLNRVALIFCEKVHMLKTGHCTWPHGFGAAHFERFLQRWWGIFSLTNQLCNGLIHGSDVKPERHTHRHALSYSWMPTRKNFLARRRDSFVYTHTHTHVYHYPIRERSGYTHVCTHPYTPIPSTRAQLPSFFHSKIFAQTNNDPTLKYSLALTITPLCKMVKALTRSAPAPLFCFCQ